MFGKHYIHLDLWPNQTVLNLSFGKTLNDHGLTLPPVCGGGGGVAVCEVSLWGDRNRALEITQEESEST